MAQEPIDVPCPRCHAAAGAKCRNYLDKNCAHHRDRVRAIMPGDPDDFGERECKRCEALEGSWVIRHRANPLDYCALGSADGWREQVCRWWPDVYDALDHWTGPQQIRLDATGLCEQCRPSDQPDLPYAG